MKLSQQSQLLIESTIKEALSKFSRSADQSIVTDIHLQANQNSAELIIFDDDDNELATCVIEEWLSFNGQNFYKEVERAFRNLLNRMRDNGIIEELPILQPYSFVLVDDDKETVSELLLIDEDVLLLNEELLKGLDEELDIFLKDLLKE
jgi:hypothetical protein